MNINTCIIGGNLSRDPEMRVTPKGTAICQFTIANNRHYTAGDGTKAEEVSFLDCEAWGKTAELIAKYFSRGKPILVEARAKQDSWEDKDTGKKRSRVKFIAERFHFVGSGKKDDAPASDDSRSTFVPPARRAEENHGPEADVPF